MARRFFYVCAGLFMLVCAYAIGARKAVAQAPQTPIVAIAGGAGQYMAVTGDGYAYLSVDGGMSWTARTNVLSGGPTPDKGMTLGELKARYR